MLLDRTVENNGFLNKFDLVNISCYDKDNLTYFEAIKQLHGRVHIFCEELDDRLDTYTREYHNEIGCKRPLLELPIDYYGNILLCCNDWKNSYKIGNVLNSSFTDIIQSNEYQKIMEFTQNRLLDTFNCPGVCKNCNNPLVTYKNYLAIYS